MTIQSIILVLSTFFILGDQEMNSGVNDQIHEEKNGFVLVAAVDFTDQTHDGIRRWYSINKENARELSGIDLTEGASNGTYLHILPDTRVTHDDPLIRGENFSNIPGVLAIIYYRVQFNTPGKYYVWARTHSRGTEDNGVHVGLNGEWPESGQRMQWCEGKFEWTWTSRQRTNDVHCGVERKLYLEIEEPGVHTIMFSMREDGFTMDQWAMSLDYISPDERK